jgi:hypothetical protein
MRLGSLLEAITKKEAIDQMKIKTLSKLKDDKVTVEKLGAGKFMIT